MTKEEVQWEEGNKGMCLPFVKVGVRQAVIT